MSSKNLPEADWPNDHIECGEMNTDDIKRLNRQEEGKPEEESQDTKPSDKELVKIEECGGTTAEERMKSNTTSEEIVKTFQQQEKKEA